jgi:hypothetical protein
MPTVIESATIERGKIYIFPLFQSDHPYSRVWGSSLAELIGLNPP